MQTLALERFADWLVERNESSSYFRFRKELDESASAMPSNLARYIKLVVHLLSG
jgi:hypothetical protein